MDDKGIYSSMVVAVAAAVATAAAAVAIAAGDAVNDVVMYFVVDAVNVDGATVATEFVALNPVTAIPHAVDAVDFGNSAEIAQLPIIAGYYSGIHLD